MSDRISLAEIVKRLVLIKLFLASVMIRLKGNLVGQIVGHSSGADITIDNIFFEMAVGAFYS